MQLHLVLFNHTTPEFLVFYLIRCGLFKDRQNRFDYQDDQHVINRKGCRRSKRSCSKLRQDPAILSSVAASDNNRRSDSGPDLMPRPPKYEVAMLTIRALFNGYLLIFLILVFYCCIVSFPFSILSPSTAMSTQAYTSTPPYTILLW